ncbi:hypothetical protein B9Z55_022657 [Caenorhabditis nigoni]|uniref:Uncharacterized protein n=1 Tax=Caenorhabditis nigoni TaxID=1611254 RepID=A0A2G5SLM8_9PELO|nr:hypothetical protein B9Z55_022657 [Caenorhabditis nigoni]
MSLTVAEINRLEFSRFEKITIFDRLFFRFARALLPAKAHKRNLLSNILKCLKKQKFHKTRVATKLRNGK